jgi:hypothetical protein
MTADPEVIRKGVDQAATRLGAVRHPTSSRIRVRPDSLPSLLRAFELGLQLLDCHLDHRHFAPS